MPRRKTPATRTPFTRIAIIDKELRAQAYPTRSRLARSCGVDERTIYRDLKYMKEVMGAPIEYLKGRGYYYDGEARPLGTVILEEGELLAIFVGQKVLAQYKGTPYEEALKSAFKKIRAALTDEVELHLDEWDRKLDFRAGGVIEINPAIFDKLRGALDCGWRVRMYYHTAYRDEKTWREVDPYFLFNVNGEWYLVGYCHNRNQLRTFVPGRILELELTDKAFTPPADLTVTDFLRDCFRVEVKHGCKPQTVKIRFAADQAVYIRERKWHASQAIEELDDGGVILTLTVTSEDELIRWVLGYGASAEVLEPPAVREKLAGTTSKLARKYNSG